MIRFEEIQKHKKDQERRKYQRVLFKKVLNAYAVIEEKGLLEVNLQDISESGIRFGMTPDFGKFNKGDKLAFRLYFSQNDYIPVTIQVARRQRVHDATDGETVEYGCKFISLNAEVKACIKDLVHFIRRYTDVAQDDRGDRQVFYL